MGTEGQCYTVMAVQVFQVGEKLRCTGLLPAGDVCIESRCSVGTVPEIFTDLLIPPDAL